MTVATNKLAPTQLGIARFAGNSASFFLAAATMLVLALHLLYADAFSTARIPVFLAALLVAHVLLCPKVYFAVEFKIYAAFVGYMIVQLLWTPDPAMAMNTLFPSVSFLLVCVLLGSLVAYHNLRAVLFGTLAGFVAGATLYTLVTGFPFLHPEGFSYNAMAVMYLFGLFITLLVQTRYRSAGILLLLSLVLLLMTVATTSIKANLGVVLGALTAALVYFGQFRRVVLRYLPALAIVALILAYIVVTNDAIMKQLSSGLGRVALGLEILQAREDLPGYSAFSQRSQWVAMGIAGWLENPVFGHGVEALRTRIGITSHTTSVDLLHNSGLIGFTLYHLMFVAVVVRLRRLRHVYPPAVGALVLGFVTCFFLMSLAGTMHYNAYLAASLGIGVALLNRAAQSDQA